jgi:hypothetical protein
LGAGIGAFFGGVGAVPGAAIGGVLGGLLGSFGGATLGAGISDKVTGVGADERRKEEEKKQRLSQVKSNFGGAIEEFDSALDRFALLARKKIYFIDDEYIIDLNDDNDIRDSASSKNQGPTPDLNGGGNVFEAEIEGKTEKHSGGNREFRYSRSYTPTGIDYDKIPSTPSNKVVPTEQLPILVRPHIEEFDIENTKEQRIDTPYGTLIRKPATVFAPAGFMFVNKDRQEDRRFRAEQSIRSAASTTTALATAGLTAAAAGKKRKGSSKPVVRPAKVQPKVPPKVQPTNNVVPSNLGPKPVKKPSSPDMLRPKVETSVQPAIPNSKDLSFASLAPLYTSGQGSNFSSMVLPLLGAGMFLGGAGKAKEKSMPFLPPSSPSKNISMPKTILPYSKYLEYESYMKVWK